MFLCQLCSAGSGPKKESVDKSGGSWEVGAQVEPLNIQTGACVLRWLSCFTVLMNSLYLWCTTQRWSRSHLFFLRQSFRPVVNSDWPLHVTLCLSRWTVQSRWSRRTARAEGVRDACPHQETQHLFKTTSQCTQPKKSTLMSHLDWGPYSNCSWVGEHLNVAPPGSRLYW